MMTDDQWNLGVSTLTVMLKLIVMSSISFIKKYILIPLFFYCFTCNLCM